MNSRPKWGGRKAQRLVAATLATYGTVCHLCGKPGADTADHVVPRALGGPDTLENLRPAHRRCNIARGTGPLGDRVTVVTGPPAAGKTTWIHANASPGDVVIDFDALAVALQVPGAPSHDHPDAVLHVAAAARSAAIAAATGPRGRARVWLIDANPTSKRRASYKRRGWRVITIDPGRDVVLSRAGERPGSALDAITAWYEGDDVVSTTTELAPSRDW